MVLSWRCLNDREAPAHRELLMSADADALSQLRAAPDASHIHRPITSALVGTRDAFATTQRPQAVYDTRARVPAHACHAPPLVVSLTGCMAVPECEYILLCPLQTMPFYTLSYPTAAPLMTVIVVVPS
jgi:hypothetical protein